MGSWVRTPGDSLDELRLAPSKGVSLTLLLGLGVSVSMKEKTKQPISRPRMYLTA